MKKATKMTESELEIYADMGTMEKRLTEDSASKHKYLIGLVDSIQREIERLRDKLSPDEATHLNPQLTLLLEQIKMNHEREMKSMDMELTKMNHELQMRVADFQDNRDIKRRDFEYKQSKTTEGLKTISDIAAAVAAAITANAQRRPFWKFWR